MWTQPTRQIRMLNRFWAQTNLLPLVISNHPLSIWLARIISCPNKINRHSLMDIRWTGWSYNRMNIQHVKSIYGKREKRKAWCWRKFFRASLEYRFHLHRSIDAHLSIELINSTCSSNNRMSKDIAPTNMILACCSYGKCFLFWAFRIESYWIRRNFAFQIGASRLIGNIKIFAPLASV